MGGDGSEGMIVISRGLCFEPAFLVDDYIDPRISEDAPCDLANANAIRMAQWPRSTTS
jgi:hypothetical protein